MLNSMESIRCVNTLGADTSLAIANLSFEGFERLFSRQFDFAKSMLDEQVQAATLRPAAGTPDIVELARSYQTQLQKVLDLSRDCMQIGFAAQGEISRCVREAMDGLASNGNAAAKPAALPAATDAEEDVPVKSRRQR